MFIELMPLIEKRAITITVAVLKDGHVRVNVVPAALAEDSYRTSADLRFGNVVFKWFPMKLLTAAKPIMSQL